MRHRLGWLRALALLAVLSFAALAGGFVWFLGRAGAEPDGVMRRTDGIAVLTGGAKRVDTALRLLLDGHADRLLVSGAHRDATLSDIARGTGLDPAQMEDRVTVGRAAATTRGNAAEIAAWAHASGGMRSIRIVTAGYHMPRAMLELRRVLPEVELVPHPVQPDALRGVSAAARLRTWTLLVGEYAKYLAAGMGLSRLATARETTRP